MKKVNALKITKIILCIISIIISIFSVVHIIKLNLLPSKYLIGISIILLIFNLIIILLISRKNKIAPIIGIILMLLNVIMSIVIINYTKKTNDFLDKYLGNMTSEVSKYDVIVLDKSSYKLIGDLDNQTLGYLKDEDTGLNKISESVKTTNIEYEDIFELYDDLVDKNIEAIMIDDAYLDIIEEERRDLSDVIRIIYTLEIENTKEEVVPDKNELKPLNIYISGSDSRSENIVNKSRSDVNMILTINPYTKKVLLTSIPRDYYVQVHGQTGLKDKLTHSGIYGIETSSKTIEDLFSIKIDYSIKVGLYSIKELVDIVGGIEVYSDKAFDSYHLKGWRVEEGMNQMDGAKALAYARERYAYASGDRHRIKNQQQVLEATLKKIMNNKSLLLKYDELLTSLGNLYRTDIPREVISIYVKDQLNTMATWNFESITVDGKGASLPTHTAPQYKRYVMIPYEEDVTKASNKIKEVYNER